MTEQKNDSKITPTGHHVLVLPDEVKEKTDGGIYYAPTGREQEQRAATKGRLVAIGPSAWKEFAKGEPWAEVGDYISFAKYASIEMEGSDGKSYALLNDQDILAVFG